MTNQYLAIDLGSHSIKALVGVPEVGGWKVVMPVLRKSKGIKFGEIEDVEAVAEEVDNLLREIEGLMKGTRFKSIVIGINSPKIDIHLSKGTSVVSRADGIISEEDKKRAEKAAQAFALNTNRSLIQTVFRDYLIDGTSKVKNPVGLNGLRLEAEALLIDVFSPVVKNIDLLKEAIGLNNATKVILAYAGAELALSNQDKEVGALALDLGASTTSMAVYENGELLDLKVFPLGGNNITSDIAIGLKTSIDTAEEIKIKEGIASVKKVNRGENFDLNDYFNEVEEGTKISKKFLAEIIEARLVEIFDAASERLKQISKFQKLAGGVVLYGGGAKMNFVKELAKEKFKLPVRLVKPEIEWYKENPDPTFVGVLGLMDLKMKSLEVPALEGTSTLGNAWDFIKRLFSW
ncbi:MAG TPA: cell division protein FtsA [Candidatus Paceibacterota bacterium]|nr:cell division protein FtsA [Candidatus Paceibacterota bacterium]HOK97274.1 cell division protein FtsA [Candidatus Paceibacterota bacterium]HPP64709.1 cell division protein FtsA [Candidatus Paceibacterota bacterium]